jgi:hypothetical protein
MATKDQFANWVEGYKQAWNTNDPSDIGKLFAPNAKYYTGPFDMPWEGRQGIVAGWLESKDEPGSYTFEYEVLASQDEVGIVRGLTHYKDHDRTYSNIWLIKLNSAGECAEFTEWWMRKK